MTDVCTCGSCGDEWVTRWNCGPWTTLEGSISFWSDVLIAGAYAAIPVTLMLFAWGLRHHLFGRRRFTGLFVLFIASCGITHALDALIWHQTHLYGISVYRLLAWAKAVCACISLLTALLLPMALASLSKKVRIALQESRE